MAGALMRFERLIESIVESAVGRTSRLKIHPIDIAKRLSRLMEAEETIGVSGRVVPNVYEVQLSADDFANFGNASGTIERELVNYLVDTAAERQVTFRAAPEVRLISDSDVSRGTFRARALNEVPVRSGERRKAEVGTETRVHYSPESAHPLDVESANAQLMGLHGDTWPMRVGETVIGRALDNDLVFDDPRVSRRHVTIVFDSQTCRLTDLDSTNGTLVNGQRTQIAFLHSGDHISLGGVDLWVRGRW